MKAELRSIEPEIKRLAELGFNIIRLLVIWKAIEPRPNPNLDQLLPEGESYLNLVKEIIGVLYSYGLFVIIDFHQDIAHEVYGGDGFPDWALAIDEFHPKPIPPRPDRGRDWAVGYYLNYLVRNTLQSFWKNSLRNKDEGLEGYPVRTHLEKTVGQTVKFFKDLNNGSGHPAILGFSPFNEPHPVGLGKQFFEENILKEFYSNILVEINKFDHKAFIFIEPRLEWTVYPATDSGIELQFPFIRDAEQIHTWLSTDPKFKEQYESQGVFSFHYYDPWTLSYALFNFADNMHNKQNEWPKIFTKLRLGEVIHLKYTSPEYSLFYDLLKIVDKDIILGKAFLGISPFSMQILTFSMSRRYDVNFMTEEDHEIIYQQYGRAPNVEVVIGKWNGRLVSDSTLTPVTQVFNYTKDNLGKLQMEYTFGGLLRGISKVVLTPEQMNMYDFTNWHDEVKAVKDDFMLGKWCSPWTKIPLNFGPSFLDVEHGTDGDRFCLRFTLKHA